MNSELTPNFQLRRCSALAVRVAIESTAIALTITLIVLGLETAVWADGGTLRTRQQAGPFIVSIFTAPEPLRAGPVDVSVLVQSSGGTVLTRRCRRYPPRVRHPPIERRRARATRGRGGEQAGQGSSRGSPGCGSMDADRFGAFQRRDGNGDVLLPVAPATVTNEPDLAVAPRAACGHRVVRRAPDADASAVIGACVEIGGRRQPRFTKPHGTAPRNDGGAPESRRSASRVVRATGPSARKSLSAQ